METQESVERNRGEAMSHLFGDISGLGKEQLKEILLSIPTEIQYSLPNEITLLIQKEKYVEKLLKNLSK